MREDSRVVDRLQGTLEAAGISVWRDTADLWPGEDWRAKIRRAITDDALVFIACFSSRSAARAKSYQNEELLLAIDQLRLRRPDDPWLIPVRFDDCDIPNLDLGGGRTLASIQRSDLFGKGRGAANKRLVAAVLRLLDQQGEGRRAEAESLTSFEPNTFSAVITADLVRFLLPLVLYNANAFPIIVQNLRIRFLDEHNSSPLRWITTRREVRPQRDDWEYSAPFSVAAAATYRVFAEFGAPALGFRLQARDYPVAVEAKLGHKEDWDTILELTLHASRIVDPSYYITYENAPDDISEAQREDVQIGLDMAHLDVAKTDSSSVDLPTADEPEPGT
jgi:hypothetical protein